MKSAVIKDVFSAQLERSLKPATINTLTKGMVTYVDRNSDFLMTLDMSRRYSFGDYDRKEIYDAIGVTEEEMIAAIKDSKYINKTNKIQSNPFYASCMLAMYRLKQLKKPKEANMIMVYMSLMMYTSIHKGMFQYTPNKQIMDYTLAHLDNSFRIRSMSSIYSFLQDNAETTFNTYENRIVRCNDDDITYVVDALWVRIKGKIKKIASAFYKNYESGNYLNMDTDSVDPNDYHEMDNNSFMVERLANKIYLRLLNHQFDDRFLKYSITRSDVSYQKLKNLVDDILSDDDENVARKFIISILEYYLTMSGKGFDYISRGDFITYMKSAYASNTEMQQMVFIKSTLDTWLNDHMISVGRTNYGKTAKLGYKKALYMFFIFVINYEAKVH